MIVYWAVLFPVLLITALLSYVYPQYSDIETDPLEFMVGGWANIEDSCETDWFEYTLSPDKKTQFTEHADGSKHSATILEVRETEFLLRYEGEETTTESGEKVAWWFVPVSDSHYKMRRIDWEERNVTTSTWKRWSAI